MRHPAHRLSELDALRGLAAISVVIFHYTGIYTEEYHPNPPALFKFPWGAYGVQLFFMISGFVIFMTLENTKRPLDFIVSRFSRLFPAYWAAVVITFIIVRCSSFAPLQVPFKDAVINLSMLQDWFHALRVDGVYWTLSIELSFYCLMLLLFIAQGLKYIEALGLLGLVLILGHAYLVPLLHVHIPHVIEATNLLKFGHLFFAGVLFYNLKTKGHTWQRYVCLALCLAVQFLVTDDIPHVGEAVAALYLLFYAFISGRLSWLVCKPLLYLGTISYTLYLVHQYVGYVIIENLFTYHANAWVRLIVPTVAVLLIASAITFTIERPAMNYIRTRYKDWRRGDKGRW